MDIVSVETIGDYTITEYNDGTGVVEYTGTEEILISSEEDYISEEEIIQAEILLNQLEIQQKLEEQEVVLAEILLNSLGGE